MLDKKLETGYNAPHSERAFTQEGLLGVEWLLTEESHPEIQI